MKEKREKIAINLLFKENLKEFLEQLKIYEKFINNKIKCEKCKRIVTSNNLGLIRIENGEILFICNYYDCMEEIS